MFLFLINEYYYIRYILQVAHELDDEEAWLREKLLLASSNDYGRDLPSTQNLRKRHKRLEAELKSHEPIIENLGGVIARLPSNNLEELKRRCRDLLSGWKELEDLVEQRGLRLEQNLAYYNWQALIGEEVAWLAESTGLMDGKRECGDTLAQAQSLIKKHEAFETDLGVHTDRVTNLIKKVILKYLIK